MRRWWNLIKGALRTNTATRGYCLVVEGCVGGFPRVIGVVVAGW
jgi:hypothetical protein